MYRGICEWSLNYADPTNPICVPKFHHEGRLTNKGTIGKKDITPDPDLFRHAYFHVLQQMSLCPSTWISTRRCCLETILVEMNFG
jgi:hypothetical protein